MGKGLLLIYFLVFSILLTNTLVFGQEEKFGKIDESIFKMTAYEKDSSADALVLFDVGKTSYLFQGDMVGFQILYKRHTRIKIFNKNGYDHANIQAYIFGNEKFSNFKATTFKLENGKIVRYDLEKDAIFDEKVVGKRVMKKFSLPQVSEGVVIEYEYEILSDYHLSPPGWDFQGPIPCLWSEYTTSIPEYYKFNEIITGYLPFDINEKKYSQDQLVYSGGTIGYSNTVHTLAIINVPAFKNEKFMIAPDDYKSKIDLTISSYHFYYNGGISTDLSISWAKWAERLMEFEKFGSQINNVGILKDLMPQLDDNDKTMTKAVAIYQFIKDNIKYNDIKSPLATSSIKKTFEAKVGSVGDINLLLVAMLKGAGFDAFPLLLSTRENGRINFTHPVVEKINYVIAVVKNESRVIFLDATNPFLPFGMLPVHCLNGSGLLVKDKGYEILDLGAYYKSSRNSNVMVRINEEGKIEGEIQTSDKDYNGMDIRREIADNDEKKYIADNWEKKIEDLKIKSYSFGNLEDIGKPLTTKLKIEGDEDIRADLIYFEPVLVKTFDVNPFNNENRIYPVEFGKIIEDNYVFNLTIPQGYEVEELPKNMSYTLLDNLGKYTYIIGKQDDILQLRISLNINTITFEPSQYKPLKEFFTQFIAKQSEQIVLKKIK